MFGVDVDKMMNPKTKKWSESNEEDNMRSFCMYVLDPMYMVFETIMNFKKEQTGKAHHRFKNSSR
jgi:elongation factor 2